MAHFLSGAQTAEHTLGVSTNLAKKETDTHRVFYAKCTRLANHHKGG